MPPQEYLSLLLLKLFKHMLTLKVEVKVKVEIKVEIKVKV